MLITLLSATNSKVLNNTSNDWPWPLRIYHSKLSIRSSATRVRAQLAQQGQKEAEFLAWLLEKNRVHLKQDALHKVTKRGYRPNHMKTTSSPHHFHLVEEDFHPMSLLGACSPHCIKDLPGFFLVHAKYGGSKVESQTGSLPLLPFKKNQTTECADSPKGYPAEDPKCDFRPILILLYSDSFPWDVLLMKALTSANTVKNKSSIGTVSIPMLLGSTHQKPTHPDIAHFYKSTRDRTASPNHP